MVFPSQPQRGPVAGPSHWKKFTHAPIAPFWQEPGPKTHAPPWQGLSVEQASPPVVVLVVVVVLLVPPPPPPPVPPTWPPHPAPVKGTMRRAVWKRTRVRIRGRDAVELM